MKVKKIFAGLISVAMILCGSLVFAGSGNFKKGIGKPKPEFVGKPRRKNPWIITKEPEKKPERKRQKRKYKSLLDYRLYSNLNNGSVTSKNSEQSKEIVLSSGTVLANNELDKTLSPCIHKNCPESKRKVPLPLSCIKEFPPMWDVTGYKMAGCIFTLKIERILSINRYVGTLIRDNGICPFAICIINNQIRYCPELFDALSKDSEEILRLDPTLPKLVYITSDNTIDLLKKYGVQILGDEKFPVSENSSKI